MRVLKLAVPIMLANITVPLVGVVDTAVMGRMADPIYLAATAIGATIFSSIFWLFGFLRMGTGGLVAQAYGANHTSHIRQTILRALCIGFVIGCALFLLQGLIFTLSSYAFDTSKELLSLVRDYFNIRIFSAPATLMVYATLGALIGLQKMSGVMIVQLVLNVSNVVLNVFFFAVLDMGIKGVALSSVIAEYLALAFALRILYRHVPLPLASLRGRGLFSKHSVAELLDINGNLFVRTLCLSLAFYWLTAASSNLGVLVLAANMVLIQMIHLMAYALDGFSHSAEALGGQAYGKKDQLHFKLSVKSCAEWGVAFSAIISLVYWLAGPDIISMMTTIEDVKFLAEDYLLWVVLAPIISIWGFLLDGIYIGVTHTREMRNGMIISLVVFLSSSLVLIHYLGNHGLWCAYYVLMLARAATLWYWYPAILDKFSIRDHDTLPA